MSMASASTFIQQVSMARWVILMEAGQSPQKNDPSHKDRHKISRGALAYRAGWASPSKDSIATVLMNPDKT